MEGRIFVSPLPSSSKQPTSTTIPSTAYPNYVVLNKLDEQLLQNQTLVFDLEETLLKTSSIFQYFMLVAFEGGGLIRALILLLFYPFLCLLSKEVGLKVMVFICFFGVKRGSFRIGRSVLPKFLLENVGLEGLEVIKKFGRRVGVTKMPRIMVECFLKDYMLVEEVIGCEIKVGGGYYLGLIKDDMDEEGVGSKKHMSSRMIYSSKAIAMGGIQSCFHNYPFTYCEEMYVVNEADKQKWHNLPRSKYPKPLIFHDGRLAFTPTPLNTLVMFMWLPFGILLCTLRIIVALLLPYSVSTPILAFIGVSYSSSNRPPTLFEKSKGLVYVCNHKLVLDPIYISYICRVHLTALTYSISNSTKLMSPIKTITLTRDREKDAQIMRNVLSRGNLVVCPEGTTCREPYLLRFSPLFAEMSDDIIPLAINVKVSMFYGTTASGMKALDPFFHMLNPWPYWHVKFLDKVSRDRTCGGGVGITKFEVANYVQAQIGKALEYKCTDLTRKDKYMVLAGNTGVVK